MKLLVLPTALLLVGCSVEVVHETENQAQSESLSTSDSTKTIVAVGMSEPTQPHDPDAHLLSSEQTQTTAKVVVPEL